MEASIGDPSLFVTVKVKSVGHWATSSVEETAPSSKVYTSAVCPITYVKGLAVRVAGSIVSVANSQGSCIST